MNAPVKIVEAGASTLRLERAILLYRSHEGHVYATTHTIEAHPARQGASVIGPGSAASKEALAEFAAAVTEATTFRGLVPENLLYTAPNAIAWFTPARARRVWFSGEHVGSTSGVVGHPPLVFVVVSSAWYVFALRATGRPDGSTPLFKAPYLNVWENGQICTGNVDLPKSIGTEAIAKFEDAFFRSRFTHPNDQRLVRYKGGAIALWRSLMQRDDQPAIPPSALLPRKETFEQALQRILTKENR